MYYALKDEFDKWWAQSDYKKSFDESWNYYNEFKDDKNEIITKVKEDAILVIGASSSGKSTLCNLLTGD